MLMTEAESGALMAPPLPPSVRTLASSLAPALSLWIPPATYSTCRSATKFWPLATAAFRDFAGTGTAGLAGDSGPARTAQISSPGALAVDPAGNVYIADGGNNRVRRVDPSGVITTIIGNGTRATAETAVPGAAALEAAIAAIGLTVDAVGRVTLAEGRIPMIRQYDPATRRLRRIAGGEPRALAGTGYWAISVQADAAGNIYFGLLDHIVRVLRPVQLSRFELASGNGQSAAPNTKLAAPLVVRVASADGPVAGIGVSFSSTGATLNPAIAFTDSEGLARTEVSWGATAGAVTIRAELEGLTAVTFQATAGAAGGGGGNVNRPAIRAGGIATVGAFGGGAVISPGTWIEIFGTNLAPVTRSWGGNDFQGPQAPTELDGVKVSINSQAAFVAYISPTQINVQVPGGIGTGLVPITVTNAGGTSESFMITAAAASPALLAPDAFQIGGVQYAVALHQDGAYAGREGLIAGVNFRPARPGDVLTLYGIGFGATTPAIQPGVVVSGSPTLANVAVRLGDAVATVQFAGLAPSAVGLYQFNIVVPADAPDGDVTLTISGVSQKLAITVKR